MSKNYLKFLFKSKKTTIIFVFVTYFAIYVATSLISNKIINPLTSVCIYGSILTYPLVCIFYSYVHNKKAIDSYFSLPVSRKKQIITTQFFIDLMIIVPFILSAIATYALSSFKNQYINIEAILMIVLIFALVIITGVAFITSIYLQAYSVFDGIVLIGAYLLVPFIIAFVVEQLIYQFVYGVSTINLDLFENIMSLPYSADNVLSYLFRNVGKKTITIEGLLPLGICLLWHLIISSYVFKKDYVNRRVEVAETVSKKFSAYPFIIGFYGFSCMFMVSFSLFSGDIDDFIIFSVIVFIIYEIANCVYRRKIKIFIKDVAFFILTTLVTLGICYVCNSTDGFGLSWKYNKNPKNARYIINEFVYSDIDQPLKDLDFVLDKYPDAREVTIKVDIDVPSSKMESCKELNDYMEKLRVKLIHDHYENKEIDDTLIYSSGNLEIDNDIPEFAGNIKDSYRTDEVDSYHYYYSKPQHLDLEDLLFLNEYGYVYIEVGTPEQYYQHLIEDFVEE